MELAGWSGVIIIGIRPRVSFISIKQVVYLSHLYVFKVSMCVVRHSVTEGRTPGPEIFKNLNTTCEVI